MVGPVCRLTLKIGHPIIDYWAVLSKDYLTSITVNRGQVGLVFTQHMSYLFIYWDFLLDFYNNSEIPRLFLIHNFV